MLQLSIYNYQFTMNYHLPINNDSKLNAKRLPALKIEKCSLQIEAGKGGAL